MRHYEYLAILIGILLFTIFLRSRYKVKVFSNFKEASIFYATILIIGTIWDNFAIYRRHWIFPGDGTVGINIGLVPVEDYIFSLILPFTVLVLYKVLAKQDI